MLKGTKNNLAPLTIFSSGNYSTCCSLVLIVLLFVQVQFSIWNATKSFHSLQYLWRVVKPRFSTIWTHLLLFWGKAIFNIAFEARDSRTAPHFYLFSIYLKFWRNRVSLIQLLIGLDSYFWTHSANFITTFTLQVLFFCVDIFFILEKLIKNTSSIGRPASSMYLWFLFGVRWFALDERCCLRGRALLSLLRHGGRDLLFVSGEGQDG